MTVCGLCGADGPYLCDRHQTTLARTLEALPALHAELAEHLVPRRTGPAEVVMAGAAGPRSPLSEDVLDLRAGAVAEVLESWLSAVQAARGWGQPAIEGGTDARVRRAARSLHASLDWIAGGFPAAVDLAREARQLEVTMLAIVGAPPPRPQVVGRCIAVIDDQGTVCGETISHIPGQPRLMCRACHCVYATQQDLLLLLHYQPLESNTHVG